MSSAAAPDPKKANLRQEIEAKLAAMSEEERVAQSKIIIEKILNHPKYKEAKRISIFLSLPSEVDTYVILNDILSRRAMAFVPQYFKGMMKMLRLLPGDLETMPVTSWGIKQHAKTAIRENALDNGGLDLIIAPGVAFTESGHRLGHGGGYYDGYLSDLMRRHRADPDNFRKPYILAVGFRQQVCAGVPVDSHDVMVDEVVTA